ncbi:MAG: hypothetical protein ACTSPV_00485 [Candidatus Hodarchaeales archaeon]
MEKLSKDELLEQLKSWKMAIEEEWMDWNDNDEQAYQQIYQLIENQPEVDEEIIKVKSSSLIHQYLPTDIYLIKKRRNDEIKKKN